MAILTTNISSSICGLHHFPRTAYLDLPLLVPSCPLPASRLVNSSRSIHPQTQYVLRPEPHDIGADPLVPVKLLFLLIILANAPSFPFLWHLRVWYTPLKAYFLVYTRGRSRYLDEWKRDNARKGGVKVVTRLRRIAWLDDCDYNLHLSNSAYAKSLDSTRMDWCIEAFSPFFTPGSHMALGASHYVFLKEIPMGMEYIMESRAAGWGEKWFYLVTEFIIYPKKSAARPKNAGKSKDIAMPSLAVPDLSTDPSSGTSTPPTTVEEIKVSALRARPPREDGGLVCCLAISEYCFKMGRVTIPPRVAIQFGLLSPTQDGQDRARKQIMTTKDFGESWLKGGWKDEPDADALGTDIEIDGGTELIVRKIEAMERISDSLAVVF